MNVRRFWIALFFLAICTVGLADTLKLKDGTVLEGQVIPFGDSYRIKLTTGETRIVHKNQVASYTPGAKAGAKPVTPGGDKPASPGGATPAGMPPGTSTAFATIKAKADKVETAIAGVGLWQSFIDRKPANPADVEAAKAELAKWQQLNKDGAEKINGKWIAGEDRKKLLKKVNDLVEEGARLEDGQMLKAVAKYEEAIKLYPKSFEAHFRLGYFYLVKGGNKRYDQAIKSLETAVNIDPASPEALSNLAIAYNFRDRYELAVLTAYKAVKITDTKEMVQNLINTIARAPRGMQYNNSKVKPVMEEARFLATKHGIGGPGEWTYLPPGYSKKDGNPGGGGGGDDDIDKGPPGVFGNGTGFFITSDGYIMTNQHVAKPGDFLMVRMSDGTEKVAKRIVIDDEQDIAIIKITVDEPVPFIKIAQYESPNIGADVTVMGFPLLSMFGMNSSVKMTRGIVTAWDKDQDKCDVTVDAQVNPGNSGGPMVDKNGNLLALVAMKTLALDSSISSYGLGISTGRIRKFLEKHKEGPLKEMALESASAGEASSMSTEELAGELRPKTVCILMCRGEDPSGEAEKATGGAECSDGTEGSGGSDDAGKEADKAGPAKKGGDPAGTGGSGAAKKSSAVR